MNKELQKLLKQINDKKNEVKSLVNDGKLDKAKTAKEELKELQNRFDLLYDLDEDEQGGIEDKVNKGTAKQVGGEKKVDKKNLVKAFVNIVKAGFLHREADEADVEVYKNALTSDTNVQYDESYNDDAYVREDGSHADKLYYPMFGGSYDGTRIRSLAGQTLMYNTNASTEITRAKANGNGWNIGSWSKRNLLDCMLKIMSKTDNSQTAFGQGQTSGYVNDASQNYGHLATGTLKNKGQFFGYKDTTHEVKVFYIEKWWGNRWDRINGLLMVGGEILAKMTPPYNLTGKDFEKVGITFTSSGNGYQKGTKSSRFGRIVNSIGGSSSTYTCDYFWWNAGITAVALVGGNCGGGGNCGADCLNLNLSAGVAGWYVGASVFLEQPIAA